MSTSSPFATSSSGILGGGATAAGQQPMRREEQQQGQQPGFFASMLGATGQGGVFERMRSWLQYSIENSADFMRRYVNQYPPLAAYLFTLMAMSAIPVSMYTVFAFVSSAVLITIAVIGFSVIEGTILLASGGLLLTVVGTITFFTTLAFGFFGFVWLGYRAFSGVFGTMWQGASSLTSSVTQKLSEQMPMAGAGSSGGYSGGR